MAGINELAKAADVKEEQVKAVFQAVATLAADERVTIKRFGSFQFKTKAAHAGINPKTKEPIQIPEKTTLKFTAAKPKKP
ncbi:MAG: HU family DNA-binding protein [Geobacter sp.]|nr:HU family DNA-binding protein [Geobacter sp.]